jgi:hypothetical protein
MTALLREFCPNVAGGQLDLEHKYVKNVPLPNLSIGFKENPSLQSLASEIRSRSGDILLRLLLDLETSSSLPRRLGTKLVGWPKNSRPSPE